jgi:hypothetical protein
MVENPSSIRTGSHVRQGKAGAVLAESKPAGRSVLTRRLQCAVLTSEGEAEAC